MVTRQIQIQRSELKYIVSETIASRVQAFVRAHLALDAHCATQRNHRYPVHSLYLDSPDLALHQSTINGERNRYKLRIRFYEGEPDALVYCEIKRREDEAIHKERFGATRSAVGEILAGRMPRQKDVFLEDARQERALVHFCQRVNALRARPVARVTYWREAWASLGHNRLRVTFDRDVCSALVPTLDLSPELTDPVSVFGKEVVLELKFTGEFPRWMREMVQACDLQRCSAAKYVDGLIQMEERGNLRLPTFRPQTQQARRRRLAVRSQFF